MKRLVIIFICFNLLSSFAATNQNLKFAGIIGYESISNSVQNHCFVYQKVHGNCNVVLDKKNGFPTLITDPVNLSLLFDESDSTFITEYFADGVRSVEKKDKHGNVTARMFIPDTFPVGPSFCRYIYGTRPTKALYSADKRTLKFYDLENKKQLATFTFPTQEVWDEVQSVSVSEDQSRLRVVYTYFDVYYNMQTGDSLFTRFPDSSKFRGFSHDGKYFFSSDSVFFIKLSADSGVELFRWEDSLFLSVGYLQDQSTNSLILHTGDTLFYEDTSKPFVRHHKSVYGSMFRIGDEIMYFDEINLIAYKYNGDTAYSLSKYQAFPLRYSQDEKSIAGVESSDSPLHFWSSSFGSKIESTNSGWYVYYWNEFPLNSPRFILDPSFESVWYVKRSRIEKRTLGDEVFLDSIPFPSAVLLNYRTNQDVTKTIVQDTSGRAFVVDMLTKEVGAPFVCPAGIVQLSPDGNYCLAIKNYLIDWETPYECYSLYSTISGQKILDATGYNNPWLQYSSAAFAPDSRSIAIGDSTDTLRIFSTADGAVLKTIKLKWAAPYTLNYTPDGKHLVYSSAMGEIAVLDALSGSTQFVYNDLYGLPIRQVVISPKGKYLLAMGYYSELAEWEPDWEFTPAEGEEYFHAANSISAVPNPAPRSSVTLTIGGEELGSGTIEIFSSLGERCFARAFEKSAASAEITIDCSGFAPGAYFARASIGGRTTATGKFVVE